MVAAASFGPFKRSLFIFRRDLRLEDNTALNAALKSSEEVVLAFIFTPTQIKNNPYLSKRSLQFLIESLEDLEVEVKKKKGKLYLFYDEPEDVIERCTMQLKIEALFINRDYTPYSKERDRKIEALCKRKEVSFVSMDDLLLHPPETTLKSNGKPYLIFTPYYNHSLKGEVRKPQKGAQGKFYHRPISFSVKSDFYETLLPERYAQQKGGRKNALILLNQLDRLTDYSTIKDYPAKDGTTRLSPHLKYTTCSPREVYHQIIQRFGLHSCLLRSLYWRDFYTSILHFFPEVLTSPFKPSFKKMKWKNDKKDFTKWCEGKTGFPLVDAGMRELLQTGFMHNRVRMVVASFLIKDLKIDWRWGEKYFATHLIDYDPAVNNGNWQWVAGCGSDAMPYFRIFNPWSQSKKFDPECIYIKKWIPELEAEPPKVIHQWNLRFNEAFLEPMLDHASISKK